MLLDGFYTAVTAREGGIAVVHRNGGVIDSTQGGRARGVAPGMGVQEARSILAGEGHFIEWQENSYRSANHRWLSVVSRFSDVVEPVDQHEALVDLSGHPRPREAAARLQERLNRSLPCSVRIGVGASRWVARLAAIRPDHLGQAISDPASYVARLPVSQLPISPEQARTLELLGYRTAGEVARLDEATLRAQFGRDALRIANAARGEGDAQVVALFPPNSAASRFVFEGGPAENRQRLDAALELLAADLGETLLAMDAVGKRMDVFLEREDGTVERRSRPFSRPIATAADVFCNAHLLLPSDPERPFEAIRIRLSDLKAAKRVQLDLDGGRSRADRDAGVAAAVQHVRGTFGDDAVRLAGEMPEPFWMKVRRAYQEANGYLWTS